jgi:hypothetical protein
VPLTILSHWANSGTAPPCMYYHNSSSCLTQGKTDLLPATNGQDEVSETIR